MVAFQILSILLLTVLWASCPALPKDSRWRSGFLLAFLTHNLFILLLMEGLSAGGAINALSVKLAWVLWSLGLMFGCSGLLYRRRLRLPPLRGAAAAWRKLDRASQVLLGLLVILITGVLLANLLSPPSIYDVMTYHLPRIRQWMQNGSLEFYAVENLRQLHHPHLNELRMLSLMLLQGGGGDNLIKLPQWLSWLAMLCAVTLLLKTLGCGRVYQLLGAVLAGTVPILLIQAMSAKNDVTVAAFLVIACVFLFRDLKSPGRLAAVAGCLAVVLCCLTKGTAYFQVFPLLAIYGILWLKTHPLQMLARAAIGLVLFLMLASPHYLRVMSVYGQIPGPSLENLEDPSSRFPLDTPAPRLMLINAIRWSATIGAPENALALRAVRKASVIAHELMRVELDDPRIGWLNKTFELEYHRDAGQASQSWHMLLVLAALVVFLLARRPGEDRQLRLLQTAFVLSAVLGFLLFVSLIKWQPWGVRLIAPSTAMLSALPALALAQSRFARPLFAGILGVGFFLLHLSFLYDAPQFSLVGERRFLAKTWEHRRFLTDDASADYQDIREYLRNLPEMPGRAVNIGLRQKFNDMEYPLWRIFDSLERPYVVRHVNPDNQTFVLQDRDFVPDVVLSGKDQAPEIRVNGRSYRLQITFPANYWGTGIVTVYLPET